MLSKKIQRVGPKNPATTGYSHY